MPLNTKIRIMHTINTKLQPTRTGTFVFFLSADLLGAAKPALRKASMQGLYNKYVRVAFTEPFMRLKGRNAGKSNDATAALG